jgi:rhomboid protease GluP
VQLTSPSLGSQITDGGRNRKNVQAFEVRVDEVRLTHTPETLMQLYEELQPELAPADQDVLKNPPSNKEKWGGVAALFIPREGYFITPLLIDVNIALFAMMVFTGGDFFLPGNETLLHWGANFKPVTLNGEC